MADRPVRVHVAAGSNVEPERHLALAARELVQHFGPVRFSRAFRNVAVGFEGPDFINLVVAFDTRRSLREVIAELQRIEALCGRARDAPKWAPRSMDLDILMYGDLCLEEPGLVLPRPDLVRRPYMLGPLAEIEPDAVHPVLGRTMGELWAAFDRGAHPLHPVPLEPGGPDAGGAVFGRGE